MKNKNYLLLVVTYLFLPFIITSCSDDDDDPKPTPETGMHGAYILNSGTMGTSSGTLDFYDFETGELNQNVFKSINGRELGDTANDMIIYGSKMYIAVTDASTLEIVDLTGKSLQQIKLIDDAKIPQKPRYLTADRGKIYVSTQDGFLSQIDTTDYTVEKRVKVGLGIEQHCILGDSLYATVFGSYPDYDNKVIAVDILTFEVADTIEVVINPTMILAGEDKMLYVLSSGDYIDIKQSIQRVNPKTKERKELITNNSLSMKKHGDYLYIISATTDASFVKLNTDYKKYNLKTAKFEEKDFVNSNVSIENATYTFVNPESNELYITAGLYNVTGDFYIISTDGSLDKKVKLSGNNPICVRFLSDKQ